MRALTIAFLMVPLAFAPVRAMADDYKWTGAYAGMNLGGAWGGAATTDDAKDGVNPGPFDYDASGVIAGGTLGYNLQLGKMVVGIEGDLGYLGLDGSGIIESAHADRHQDLTLDGGLYGDITGRLGWSFNRAMVYGKGGLAFYDGGASQATTAPGYDTTGTDTFTGWVAGGGVEYAITEKLSAKIEYLHFDFGDQGGYRTARDRDDEFANSRRGASSNASRQ